MISAYNIYQQPFQMLLGLALISIWSLVWKGFGLWNSAKNKQKGWFIAILILNTAGLLPIIYLLWFRPNKSKEENEKEIKIDSKEDDEIEDEEKKEKANTEEKKLEKTKAAKTLSSKKTKKPKQKKTKS